MLTQCKTEIKRMTAADLIKPRFKMINSYPGAKLKKGSVIVVGHNKTYPYEAYPHIFKKMEWWEERALKDLPKHVKFVWNNKMEEVCKVKEYIFESEGNIYTPVVGFEATKRNGMPRVSLSGWVPATEQEYLEHAIFRNVSDKK